MLSKLASIRTTTLLFILVCIAAFAANPASAASMLTFVSGKGNDSGNCANPANPCRTFKFALGVTSAGGEIKALDPANYVGFAISQSVTITGVEGASINPNTNGISVNAGASDVVNISNLTFDGHKAAARGLVVLKVGSLNVRNCVIRNFTSDGIFIAPPAGTTFFRLTDVESSDNGGSGFYFEAKNSAVTNGVLDRVKLHHNTQLGLNATRSSNTATLNLVVSDSEATNNQSIGFLSAAQGTFALHRSVSTGNAYGLYINTQMGSTGDNLVYGNTTADTAGSTFAITPK